MFLLNLNLSHILDELRNHITENRLQSAISKFGSLNFDSSERIEKIEQEFLNDTLIDLNENNDNLLEELDQEEKNWIKERIKSEIKKTINATNKN